MAALENQMQSAKVGKGDPVNARDALCVMCCLLTA